jgi:uncharacterized alpha/beta hydrolase family protein
MKKCKATLLVMLFIGIGCIAQAADKENTAKEIITKNEIPTIFLARSPGGCSSEQCCHAQMQRCYDEGGNERCSDQYDECVRNLRD